MEEISFLTLLVNFAAKKLFNLAGDKTKRRLIEEIQKAANNPQSFGLESLNESQEGLIKDLITTQYSLWQQPLSLVPRPLLNESPIVIIGPSGVGKSMIADRLMGKEPNPSQLSSVRPELRRIKVASWPPGVKLIVAPGDWEEDSHGIKKVISIIASNKPPKIICLVTCYGYHATEGFLYRGTYNRPSQDDDNNAETQEEFIEKCLQEEIIYLKRFMKQMRKYLENQRITEIRKRIPKVLLIINKKDLWQSNHKESDVIQRYTNPDSEFGRVISNFRRMVGLDYEASYQVFPNYTFWGGFHPDPSVKASAFTREQAEASALVLRALIYNMYRRT